MLQQLNEQLSRPPTSPPLQLPATQPQAIAKIGYSHAAMIDLIITNPGIAQNDIARHFGYSAPWVSRILASDAFQAAFALRRGEIIDPAVMQSVEEGFRAITLRAQEILLEKLSRPAAEVPPLLALKALEVAKKAESLGAGSGPRVDVHVHLEETRERLRNLLRREKVAVQDSTPLPALEHQNG